MKMTCALRIFLLALAISAGGIAVAAQDTSRADVAVGYTYIHSNAPPAGCGCFSFNGGSIAASWMLNSRWAFTSQLAGSHANPIGPTTISPTMTTYLFGPRYSFARGAHRTTPFANVLIGASHASDGYFPTGTASSTSASAFAMAAGGGVDISVGRHFSVRPITAEYLLTRFPNGVNSRENNFRITTGIVFKLSRSNSK